MKLSQKLSLSSGFLTLLVAAGVIVGIYSMKRIYGSAEELTGYSVPGIIESLRVDTIVSDITLNTIRHVYTEDEAGIRRREDTIAKLTKRLGEIQQRYSQSIQTEDDRRLWDAYLALSRELASLRDKALALSRQQKIEEALAVLDGPYVDTYYRLSEALNKVVTLNVNAVDRDSNDIISVINGANAFLTTLLIVSVLLSAGASFVLIRSVMKDTGKDPGELAHLAQRVSHGDYDIDDGSPRVGLYGHILTMITTIKESMSKAEEQSEKARDEAARAREAMSRAEEAGRQAETKTTAMLAAANRLEEIASIVSSASAELAAQIEQSERGAAEQAARVTETAAAMEEMNSTVLEVAKNAGQAADVSASTRQKAEAGALVVRRSVDSIQVVQTQAVRLKSDMTRLDENARAISQIMSVISDIADQTNLLALNAAIEAARAGDAGRGFAVVADEVRKLAEKTMASTTDVGAAIKAIQQSVAESMSQVDASVNAIEEATGFANESGLALNEIVTMVDQAADQVRAIATASEQQSSTSEEINRSVAHVNTIAAETARAMSEAAHAVSELASQSQVLSNLIDEMKRV